MSKSKIELVQWTELILYGGITLTTLVSIFIGTLVPVMINIILFSIFNTWSHHLARIQMNEKSM